MENKRAIIVTGGNPPSKDILLRYIDENSFIIGIDKGCNALREYNLIPNLILGDFDSINRDILNYYKDLQVEILKFPPEKDYSDTDLGYEISKERGFKDIIIFGATGTRMDHFLGNLGILLKALRENIKVQLIDNNNKMFLVKENAILKGKLGDVISFHALCDEIKNFSIYGAKYELRNYNMTLLEPRAICNEFLDKDIEITFDSGIILVIYSND